MTDKDEALAAYPVRVPISMHWGEMDSYGHLNNVIYFRYFETARMAYFQEIAFTSAVAIGPILSSTSCRFRIPLQYPDALWAAARVTDVGDDRFTMEMAVYSTTHQKIAATGEGQIVAFDYRTQKKTTLPDDVRVHIARLERRR
jgi:acyl-CoA thioester hydrolase